jgi:ABC-type spermidine/putrescine transport system permease subunit I
MRYKLLIQRNIFGVPHLLWQTLFFIGPLMLLFFASLKQYELGRPKPGFTLQNYRSILFSSPYPGALGKSLLSAVGVSILSTVIALIAILGAWLIRNNKLRISIIMGCALVFFAGVIPRTYVLEFLLSDRGLLGHFLMILGHSGEALILYSTFGITISYLPILLPLCITVLYVARRDVPILYIDAAADLGAGWLMTQTHIVIPSMKPGIIVSVILSFILVVGDVVVVDLIGGSQVYTASTQILDYVKIDDWGSAAAASIVLLLIVALVIGLGMALFLRRERA